MSAVPDRLRQSPLGQRVAHRSRPWRARLAARIAPGSVLAVGRGPAREPVHRPFDSDWRTIAEWNHLPSAKLAVVVHVFYAELAGELLDRIEALPVPADVIITNSSGQPLNLPDAASSRHRFLVLEVENRGRDILPLVDLANARLLDPYELILKIHTKKSGWRSDHGLPGDGIAWRNQLLDSLMGGSEHVVDILRQFDQNRSLGLITGDGSLLGPPYWGDNQVQVEDLLRRLELPLDEGSLLFAAGSMYWVRGFILAGLQSLRLTPADFPPESGQVNQTTAHAVERLIGILTTEAGLTLSTTGKRESVSRPAGAPGVPARFVPGTQMPARAHALAFYLPQFHPIPENDAWWGEGFTEWSNVIRGRPVYRGHYQPRVPDGMGFYDLRTPETVKAQCDMASGAGLSGFMYYHYWFSGQPLLERPISDRLEDDNPMPFCLLWANENWTRTWDGGEDDILLEQDHERVAPEDYLRSVLPVLRDARYVRAGGRALLGVYRPLQLPHPRETFDHWRQLAREEGVGELLLIAVDGGAEFGEDIPHPHEMGLDATFRFAPHGLTWQPQSLSELELVPHAAARIWSYRTMVDRAIASYGKELDAEHFPGVMVAFDNTARRPHMPDIWYGSNPYTYHRWLSAAVDAVADRPLEERLVFINAWNEWAEAAVLEPTDKYGYSFLTATHSALTR